MSLARQGKIKESQTAFEYVITRYPVDPAADVAREAMKQQ
jgi:TolA-binding protein